MEGVLALMNLDTDGLGGFPFARLVSPVDVSHVPQADAVLGHR
jgi:hypothetical protein